MHPSQGRGLVQLGSQMHHAAGLPQEQNASILVPLLEVDQGAQSDAEHLAVLDDGSAVLGLSPNGTLLVHQLDPPLVVELQLPSSGGRWMGLCSPGGRELFLVGKTHMNRDFTIWRTFAGCRSNLDTTACVAMSFLNSDEVDQLVSQC
eukprot:symbB.v1.2.001853.t1/scaffold77.1/size347087/24